MNNEKIWLSSPHMGPNEQKFVDEAFATNWVAPVGPHVNAFEEDLRLYTGSYAAVLSNGTAALHLGLILLDVKRDDYVLCQSMTFSASANPIVYQGAIPVFIDSEETTWNMCPKALREAIERCISGRLERPDGTLLPAKKPKAILPVHLYGMPAQMDEIVGIAKEYDIPILEDAAEALGSHIDNKSCGTFGEIGVLSFNGNKIITTSSGGAMISHSSELVEKARFLSTQARDAAPHYQHSHIGYNYRMSNVLAGIGRGQMQVLPDRVAARRANYERYRSLLSDVEGIGWVHEPKGYFSNRWLSTVLIDPAKTNGVSRETVRLALEKDNIEARPLWKPMHMQPIFSEAPYVGESVAENLFEQGLCLPSGSNLTDEDFVRIFAALKKVFSL
ncbi:MAG: pyridoxal phosphate-dependent aminotransferase [Flavobacteriales bacterium]|nr:MAG: pyridoxal phosphate-dependent aminotransferase [Flavobacteriales bacterium]